MLIKLPRTDNRPPMIIKSENIQNINIFDLVFDVWLKDNEDSQIKISCPISVLPELEALLEIVDLTKHQKDPF